VLISMSSTIAIAELLFLLFLIVLLLVSSIVPTTEVPRQIHPAYQRNPSRVRERITSAIRVSQATTCDMSGSQSIKKVECGGVTGRDGLVAVQAQGEAPR